ncbi:hypothetical protein HanXRQr2_Chr01g0001261 [Helianthus annuus]|uniref:Uncharacterized protein n=1 Tax=Helianthus annuus TaxID=4232 RepID=A0A9K3JSB0_HELAN|nr:hypothetical protein HanXRQr2_Chr01g0001261 [Helianthus annuus]KAJ0514270.1 hypothetical protein HanHA300_Chr10g0367691 [Helianthus annuus]KAJ0530408.1 hypothetical protein HanHA89_Chr10g0389561 [Helianthus annuus]KAJ0620804.1 hypothetical protein HanIR_Chr01g0001581 [Helianthus annuus]KAJ0776163.1 hypothetical protein HanLR1_Chr02g0042471 [Helianthus annuus]
MWNHVKMDGSVEVQRAKKTQSSKRTQIRTRKVSESRTYTLDVKCIVV